MSSIWQLCHQILSLAFTLFGGLVLPVIQNVVVRFTPPRFHTWFVTPVPAQPTLPTPPAMSPEQLQHIFGGVQEGNQPLVNEVRVLVAQIQADRQGGSRLEAQLAQGLTFTIHGSLRSPPIAPPPVAPPPVAPPPVAP